MSEAYRASAAQLRRLAATVTNPAAREQFLSAAREYEHWAKTPRCKKTGPRGGRLPGERNHVGRAEHILHRDPSEWLRNSPSPFRT
jgi:hypothetical protein